MNSAHVYKPRLASRLSCSEQTVSPGAESSLELRQSVGVKTVCKNKLSSAEAAQAIVDLKAVDGATIRFNRVYSNEGGIVTRQASSPPGAGGPKVK